MDSPQPRDGGTMMTNKFDRSVLSNTARSKSYFGNSYTEKNPMNTSTAKQMFSFSKDRRFQHYRQRLKQESGAGKAFGYTQRFKYYPSQIKHGDLPSPARYDIKGQFSPQNKSQSFSFGLAREQMNKMHIQAIEKVGKDKLPGPGQYQPPKTFGNDGLKFSMRPLTVMLNKQKELPGPGQYQQPDLVGHLNSTKFTSIQKAPQSPSFPKAKNRFETPTFKNVNPGPGNYSPKNNLNEDIYSLYKSFGKTLFGKDERKALEDKLYQNVEFPGPGNYQLPTEFGKYDPPTHLTFSPGDTKRSHTANLER
ncbi:UNKNOWN [Stylonychia lemnae]|uniref:Uncharacterized protein n=1 Tax=Stylonychia lemnae TaxID=5949 RepID=A0A078AE38_STYLE|nr:UNKNOWN [Stylonychia lemnae]|eukprot:CDW79782.1 UNKNOWN [Stylonychia lemnae]